MNNLIPTASVVTKCGPACHKTNAVWSLSPRRHWNDAVRDNKLSGYGTMSIVRLFICFLLATGFALAASNLSPDIPKGAPYTMVEVIVQFNTLPNTFQIQQYAGAGQLKAT